jgi:hypothetical protein
MERITVVSFDQFKRAEFLFSYRIAKRHRKKINANAEIGKTRIAIDFEQNSVPVRFRLKNSNFVFNFTKQKSWLQMGLSPPLSVTITTIHLFC